MTPHLVVIKYAKRGGACRVKRKPFQNFEANSTQPLSNKRSNPVASTVIRC